MENLLTSMSFWGMAAIIATTSQLVWEHVRGSIRTEGRGKIAQVTSLSYQSLSFLDRHYKSFTLSVISLFGVLFLNNWVIPAAKPLSYLIIFTGALSYAVSMWVGQWISAYQTRYPKSFLNLLFEGKQPRYVITLLLGMAGLLPLLSFFQLEMAWSSYMVFNLFAAYSLGISSIALLDGIFADKSRTNLAPSTNTLISADRTDALSGAVLATALLGITFIDLQSFQKQFNGLGGVLLPIILALSGTLLSGVGSLLIRLGFGKNLKQTAFAEKLASTLLMIIASYVCVQVFLPKVWVFGTQEYEAIQVFYAAQAGLICGLLISKLIHIYEQVEKIFIEYLYLKAYRISFVDKMIHNCLRIFSSAVPLVLLIGAFLLAYHWVGLYGLCIAVVAMQANLRTELSTEVAELEKLVLRSKKIFFQGK
jgi:K(+)-stimulated pyrophosphate-energized sodium pump